MTLAAGQTGHLADHQEGVYVVVHGATAGTARPTLGSAATAPTCVLWEGSVEPTNAVNNDLWFDTTNSLLKVKVSGSFVTSGSSTYSVQIIAETVLSTTAAAITFSSIPGTFRHLAIELTCRGDGSGGAQSLHVQLNGDTGSNYDSHNTRSFNGAAAGLQTIGGTSMRIGGVPTVTSSASRAGGYRLDIPDYARAVLMQTLVCSGGYSLAGSAGNVVAENTHGTWRTVAAVTQVSLFPTAGNFVSGTVATLYGIGGA